MTLRTCAFLIILAAPALAAAAPLDDAKAAFAAGKLAFERGEYERALAEFQKANAIAPAPSLLYNMGKTYEALGRYRDAGVAFDKYLETYGAPQTDEDKQFQENLRARIASDRGRPDRGAAQPAQEYQQPPPQTYQQQQQQQGYPPNYYYPPQQQQPQYGYNNNNYLPNTYRITKADMLLAAHARRNRAVALIVVGTVLDVLGIVFLIDGLINDHHEPYTNGVEVFVGASLGIVGITLWAPGAASYVKSSRRIREVEAMPDNAIARGVLPAAVMVSSPVFRF